MQVAKPPQTAEFRRVSSIIVICVIAFSAFYYPGVTPPSSVPAACFLCMILMLCGAVGSQRPVAVECVELVLLKGVLVHEASNCAACTARYVGGLAGWGTILCVMKCLNMQ